MIKRQIKKIIISTFLLISMLILFLSGCYEYRQDNFVMYIENSINYWKQENACFQVDSAEKKYIEATVDTSNINVNNYLVSGNGSLLDSISPYYFEFNKDNTNYWMYLKKENGNYLRKKNNRSENFMQQKLTFIPYYEWLVFFAEMPNCFKYDKKTNSYILLPGNTKFLYSLEFKGKKLGNEDKREYSVQIVFSDKKISLLIIDNPFLGNGYFITQKFTYEKIDFSLPNFEEEIE